MARPRDHSLPCGTPAAYFRHRYHGEEPCPEDRAAWAARKNGYDRRRGAKPRRKPRHGTWSAYTNLGCRCPACHEAMLEYHADNRAGVLRRDADDPTTAAVVVLDILETWAPDALTTDVLVARVQDLHPEWAELSIKRTIQRLAVAGRIQRAPRPDLDEMRWRFEPDDEEIAS